MPRIEIESPGKEAYGTVLKMNGIEVAEVRSIDLSFRVDDAVTARVEVLVTDRFQFDSWVDLHVTAVVMPGYVLEETISADGSRSYRARAETNT